MVTGVDETDCVLFDPTYDLELADIIEDEVKKMIDIKKHLATSQMHDVIFNCPSM